MGTTLRSKIAIWMGLVAVVSATAAFIGLSFRYPFGLAVVVASPLVGWLIGRFIASRVVSPLERLGVSARVFASGNHAARADTSGPRETRIVAEAFNQMAGQIAAPPRRSSTAMSSPKTSSASSRRSRWRPSGSAGSPTTCSRCSASKVPPASCRSATSICAWQPTGPQRCSSRCWRTARSR